MTLVFLVQRINKETFKLVYNHHSYNSTDIKKCLYMTRNLNSIEQFQKYSKTSIYKIAYCLLQENLTTLRKKYLKNKFNIYGRIIGEIPPWVDHCCASLTREIWNPISYSMFLSMTSGL